MWAHTIISRTAWSNGLRFSSPMYLASGFSPTSRSRVRAAEYVSCCAPSTGSPESNRDFVSASQGNAVKTKRRSCEELQGRYAQETVSHKQQPTRTVNEKNPRDATRRALKSDNACFAGGGSRSWNLDLAYMMMRHLQKNSLSSSSWRGGMALIRRTTSRKNVKTSWMRDAPRNAKPQLSASITVCMRLSVCYANKQTFHALGCTRK